MKNKQDLKEIFDKWLWEYNEFILTLNYYDIHDSEWENDNEIEEEFIEWYYNKEWMNEFLKNIIYNINKEWWFVINNKLFKYSLNEHSMISYTFYSLEWFSLSNYNNYKLDDSEIIDGWEYELDLSTISIDKVKDMLVFIFE
jgi:hypothetical protein